MIQFPPRDETLDFFQTLEQTYLDAGRAEEPALHVDREGIAVWIQQYLLYRVNGAGHSEARAKVLRDIDQIWHPQPIPPEPSVPAGRVYGIGRAFAVDGELLIGPGDSL
jgi:hypothetical protein